MSGPSPSLGGHDPPVGQRIRVGKTFRQSVNQDNVKHVVVFPHR